MSLSRGPKIVRDGLVFNMDFLDRLVYPGSGTYCYDLSSSNTVGELVSSPTWNSLGYFTFNGSSSYIKIPNSTALNSQTISLECWVKIASTAANAFWFEKGNVNTQYALFQEGNWIQWRQMWAIYSNLSTATATYMSAGPWYQVVGTVTSGARILYINGHYVNSDAPTGTLATNDNGMSIGVFGGYNGARDYYNSGSQAIVRVYNKILSAAEVHQNFDANKGRFGYVS